LQQRATYITSDRERWFGNDSWNSRIVDLVSQITRDRSQNLLLIIAADVNRAKIICILILIFTRASTVHETKMEEERLTPEMIEAEKRRMEVRRQSVMAFWAAGPAAVRRTSIAPRAMGMVGALSEPSDTRKTSLSAPAPLSPGFLSPNAADDDPTLVEIERRRSVMRNQSVMQFFSAKAGSRRVVRNSSLGDGDTTPSKPLPVQSSTEASIPEKLAAAASNGLDETSDRATIVQMKDQFLQKAQRILHFFREKAPIKSSDKLSSAQVRKTRTISPGHRNKDNDSHGKHVHQSEERKFKFLERAESTLLSRLQSKQHVSSISVPVTSKDNASSPHTVISTPSSSAPALDRAGLNHSDLNRNVSSEHQTPVEDMVQRDEEQTAANSESGLPASTVEESEGESPRFAPRIKNPPRKALYPEFYQRISRNRQDNNNMLTNSSRKMEQINGRATCLESIKNSPLAKPIAEHKHCPYLPKIPVVQVPTRPRLLPSLQTTKAKSDEGNADNKLLRDGRPLFGPLYIRLQKLEGSATDRMHLRGYIREDRTAHTRRDSNAHYYRQNVLQKESHMFRNLKEAFRSEGFLSNVVYM